MKRIPLEIAVFEDLESARRYHKQTGMWMRYVSRSFVSMSSKLGITSGKVLDVGTGTGSLAIELTKGLPGIEVVGLDLSAVVLQVARDNARESEVTSRVAFEHGDATEMPFEDDAFDLVISNNTLHLIKNAIKMFDEMERILKPAGKFLISDFRRSWLGILTPHIRAAYSPQEVQNLLRQSKLQDWEIKDSLLWLSIVSKS